METGTIRHWNDTKGFGFITADNGSRDIFMHISKWQGEGRPVQGARVQFAWAATDKNPEATEVLPIDGKRRAAAPIRSDSRRSPAAPVRKGTLQSAFGMVAILIAALFGFFKLWYQPSGSPHPAADGTTQSLPVRQNSEQIAIQKTIALIQKGGAFPYERDGIVFANRENRLPAKPRGYYHEYTVPTPGASDRGARRIITGGSPPEVYYYTRDHYRSFQKLEVQ